MDKKCPAPSHQWHTGLYLFAPAMSGKEINNAAKPVPLLKHLIHWYTRYCVVCDYINCLDSSLKGHFGTRVLDLCGGSGNASRAAIICGQQAVYVEKDKKQAEKAGVQIRSTFKRMFGVRAGDGRFVEHSFKVHARV